MEAVEAAQWFEVQYPQGFSWDALCFFPRDWMIGMYASLLFAYIKKGDKRVVLKGMRWGYEVGV